MPIDSEERAAVLKQRSLRLAAMHPVDRRRRPRKSEDLALEEGTPQTRAGERDAAPTPEDQVPGPAQSGPWKLPAPASGGTYTQTELAALLNVKVCTVRDWVARGNRGIRLQTLRAPRGRLTPGAVCEFLEAVNGIEVGIEERR
jgi:hypothetical protein